MKKFLKTARSKALLAVAALTTLSVAYTRMANAAPIVSDETIREFKALTTITKLKNGMPVILRQVPGSDIAHVMVTFDQGMKDLPPGRKALSRWLLATMPRAAQNFPRELVYATVERYSLVVNCNPAVEYGSCALETINDHWDQGFNLLAAIVKSPTLNDDDAGLEKQRLEADLKDTPEDPGSYINELVNKIYYPRNHPYRSTFDEALAELTKLKPKDLKALHKQILNASQMHIVVVSSLPNDKVLADLEKAFGAVATAKFKPTVIKHPPYDSKNIYKFEARQTPTAWILAKFDAPGALSKDMVASMILFDILDHELGDEVRTKRSLSYSVYAHSLLYTVGIGIMGASTSKPEQALEAIRTVVDRIKAKTYTTEELDEFKTSFATHYFLQQETHASLASALSRHFHFYRSVDPMYELPRLVEKVTPQDIKRVAGQVLTKMRVAVIYGRDKFKDNWAKQITSF